MSDLRCTCCLLEGHTADECKRPRPQGLMGPDEAVSMLRRAETTLTEADCYRIANVIVALQNEVDRHRRTQQIAIPGLEVTA